MKTEWIWNTQTTTWPPTNSSNHPPKANPTHNPYQQKSTTHTWSSTNNFDIQYSNDDTTAVIRPKWPYEHSNFDEIAKYNFIYLNTHGDHTLTKIRTYNTGATYIWLKLQIFK
jgi:hypothetical protein